MNNPPVDAELWEYLSETQKDLITEGDYLMNQIIRESKYNFKDYSFLVFPYAKAFEGYLKQLFLDLKFISHLDYISDHFRIGKFMSPNLMEKLGDRSLYYQLMRAVNQALAETIWQSWKLGRNQIFHYYPHNVKAVTFEDAERINQNIIFTMTEAFHKLQPKSHKKLQNEMRFKAQ